MNVLDLFSGIGGFSLGLERAGMRTVAFCEVEPYCRAVLLRHWPSVPCYDDVRTLTAEIDGFESSRAGWRTRLANPSELYGGADGVPFGMDRNRGIGNAVSPPVAEIIGRAIMNAAHVPPEQRGADE